MFRKIFTIIMLIVIQIYGQEYGNPSAKTSDSEIYKNIQNEIGPKSNLNIQVYNGIVTLKGNVNSAEEKQNIEKSIQKLDGIRVIMNLLTEGKSGNIADQEDYSQNSYGVSSDNRINDRINNKLSAGAFGDKDDYSNVTFNTSNGTVTLEGKVKSVSEQQKLLDDIQKIEGVKSVKSNLTIEDE